MNISLVVAEKIRAYFKFPANQFVSFADMARTMDKDDFTFMADIPNGKENDKDLADKIWATKAYFSYLANSLPTSRELVWNPELNPPDKTLHQGYKNVLENGQLNKKNQPFVKKWTDEDKNLELAERTDPGTDMTFLEASCSPSFYDQIEQPWTKMTLNASELASLDAAVRAKYPADMYDHVDPILNGEELDIKSLSFEIQITAVQRNWFKQDLLNSRHWKMAEGETLSNGTNSSQGMLPAYTSTMIFVKNVQWELVPGSPKNVVVLKKIQNGTLTLGSLPVQGIPMDANLNQLGTVRSATLRAKQYEIYNLNLQSRLDKGDLIIKTNMGTGIGTGTVKPGNVTTLPIQNTNVILTTSQINSSVLLNTTPILTGHIGTVGKRGGDDLIPPYLVKGRRFPIRTRYQYHRYYPELFVEAQPTKEKFTLSGTVSNKSGNAPLAGVELTVLHGNDQRLVVKTNAQGRFNIPSLSKGKINVTVTKDGFQTRVENLNIEGNLNSDFALTQVAATIPAGTFFLFGVVCTRFPALPNPLPDGEYAPAWEAVDVSV